MEKLKTLCGKLNPALQKYRIPILVLFAGMLLLVLSPRAAPTQQQEKINPETQQVDAGQFQLQEFEEQLAQILSQMEGVGRVKLTLSLKSTEEAVYAVNIRQTQQSETVSSYESQMSIVSSGTQGQSPVLVKSLYPVFRGALVLCDGADSDTVRLAVTQAVSTVCGIGTDKISVMKMQG